ncbi:glutamate-1-semialdehyde 2,1-aminomutase [Pontimonas salivibrio]|uniref:Glutamate-1-semialdehyde 2,1-aminomutase n=1 Tax=Pontimonas salivibrio TaxID=1159327 RepID=A0A2L2BQB8_9MICO|nr:glutamate-1-semialdehyde 2,1-aminomutase [Pontimonas salivibrio]AVG23849.1 glutamate-1-semialdehyde 2,1-aminomutase [Pontimonas salivibrio]
MTPRNESERWHERAQSSIPGGVSSPVRAFSAVGGTPMYMKSGAGSRVTDIDGNSYVDFIGSWGPMIMGHAHPEVVHRVTEVAADSSSFGAPHQHEVLLAEEIIRRVAPVERVRFVSSGTEAVMTALRLARAATGRNLIVKFAGCYHGHMDSLLVQAGSGVATLAMANSPGVPPGHVEDTIVVPYNDPVALRHVFDEHSDRIAAVITESSAANMGVVPPTTEFADALFHLAGKHGALVILDEVMTGFRVSSAGWWGLVDGPAGRVPDLLTFGKVIGGGFPLAAVGGRKDVMELLAPTGPVYQAGTLSGNPVASIAGLTTLQLCQRDVYDHLDSYAHQAGEIVSEALTKEGVAHRLQRAGNLFSVFFTADEVHNFDDSKAQDTKAFARFFHSLLDHGVSIPPSAFEAWFVSAAHNQDDLQILSDALVPAARAAAGH